MTTPVQGQTRFVPHGGDRFSEERGLGITTLVFKVASEDTDHRLFIIEQTMHARGGPPRHLHFAQDEWFYPIEGEFIAHLSDELHQLSPGASLFAPRNIPHV